MTRGKDLALRDSYRQKNPSCELTKLLLANCVIDTIDKSEPEIHHIVGGSGRKDSVSNIISLSPSVHRFVESNVTIGRILCLCIKSLKNEINPKEYRTYHGQRLVGWLQNHEAEVPYWLTEMYKNLLILAENLDGSGT
jgi:hypothetical protein